MSFVSFPLLLIFWASVANLISLSLPDRPDESHDTAVLQEGESNVL